MRFSLRKEGDSYCCTYVEDKIEHLKLGGGV